MRQNNFTWFADVLSDLETFARDNGFDQDILLHILKAKNLATIQEVKMSIKAN